MSRRAQFCTSRGYSVHNMKSVTWPLLAVRSKKRPGRAACVFHTKYGYDGYGC